MRNSLLGRTIYLWADAVKDNLYGRRVYGDEKTIKIDYNLAGYDKSNIDVKTEGTPGGGFKIHIAAKKEDDTFNFSEDLTSNMDPNSVKAEYKNGLLTVSVSMKADDWEGYKKVEIT